MPLPVKKSPPGSHAWCTDCAWTNRTDECERFGRIHSDAFQHIVHVYEPEEN